MKRICTLLVLLITLTVAGQKKLPTTQKVSAEDLKEMREALKELEEDDPESAKALRKIIQDLEGGNKQAKPPVVTYTKPAPFISPKIKINLAVPIATPTVAQSTDRLLWMKGKKINDTTLKSSSGALMLYMRKKNIVVIQPDQKNDPFIEVVRGLQKYEEATDKYLKVVDKDPNAFFYVSGVESGLEESKWMRDRYYVLAANTINLNEGPKKNELPVYEPPPEEPPPTGPIPDSILNRYWHVMKLVKNYPSLEIPDPPAREYDICWERTPQKISAYQKDLEKWVKDFSAFEVELMQNAILVLRDMNRLVGPDAARINNDMDNAIDMALGRYQNKIVKLEAEFGPDFRYVQAIILQNLTFSKQKIMFTGGGVDEPAMIDRLVNYLDQYEKYGKKLLMDKNYGAIVNIHTLFSIGRNKEFLGRSDEGGNFVEMANAVHNFNRFKMTIEYEFKVESESIRASGTMKSVEDFYVSLAPEKDKFQLFASNTKYLNDQEGKFYVPLKITSGHKDQKEEDDKWVPYEYTGPEDVMMAMPIIRISFCNDYEMDSVYLSILRYSDDNYMDKAGKFPKAYTIDLIGFSNLLSMNPEGAEATVKDQMEIAGNLMRINNITVASKGNRLIDKWRTDEAKMLEGRRQAINFSQLAVSNKAFITFDANNSGDVLFTAETNITQDGDFSLTKGLVKIKVVHDPIRD